MQNWATFLLVIGLVLGALPHAFCNCGCAGEAVERQAGDQRAAPACPHCCPSGSAPTQDPPQPCKCATCETVKAAFIGSQVQAPSPDSGWPMEVGPADLCVAPLASLVSGQDVRTGPSCTSLLSGCALTILLGRLLL
ncbi:MAG: hypothetical protein HQ582_10570 [Planctomycetes bacterium]|nr:hypothetical protein [Planctomycetota bacterium]